MSKKAGLYIIAFSREVHPLPDFTLTEPEMRISPEVSGLFQAGDTD